MNTKDAIKTFSEQIEECPFCDADLSQISTMENLVMKEKSTILDYACSCQIVINKDEKNDEDLIEVRQACSNKTEALRVLLSLKQQLKNK